MKITYEIVESILKKLPIGFYLKRDIPVCLSPDGRSSFYNPVEGTITLSYPMLSSVIADTDISNEEVENYVRDLLYHEISHVILTPHKMRMTKNYNIFEDERIETILKKYYHRVNFKEFIKAVNNYDPSTEPESADDEFYRTVRFRDGEKRFTDRVNQIIKTYMKLNATNDDYDTHFYKEAIDNLYYDIVKKWEDKKKETPPEPPVGPGPDGPVGKEPKPGEEKPGEEPGEPIDEPVDEPVEEEIEEAIAKGLMNKALDKLFKKYDNRELEDELKKVIFKYSGRRQNGAKAINGYNGRVEPRMTIRDDYKWFMHKNDAGSFNRYADTRLNLFIDVSGSFHASEDAINEIVKALINIEKSRDDFEVCIATMGDENKVIDKSDRTIHCSGGNYLLHDIYDVYNSLQHKQKNNYNIVVFDGDAQSFDSWGRERRAEALKANPCAFGAFNHPNTTIISDYSNQDRILVQSPRSKNIFTKNYVDELQDNILKMLGQLIR